MSRIQIIVRRFLVPLTLVALITYFCIFNFKVYRSVYPKKSYEKVASTDLIDFEGFNYVNGSKHYLVPNIVHLLYFDITEIKFTQAISFYSIYLNHRPDWIYIHCELCNFTGHYWNEIKSINDLFNRIVIKKIKSKPTVFGQKLLGKFLGTVYYHRSDVWRLMILMNYGGIFLDNDVFVVNSLNKYRKFEMALSFESDEPDTPIGNQVIFAHRNARLLRAHFDFYRRDYQRKLWFYNAGQVPANILRENPALAHVVHRKLGTHDLFNLLFWKNYMTEWRYYDTIHLMLGHRWYRDANFTSLKEFNSSNILSYNFTYGYMCRNVMRRVQLLKRGN